MKKVKRNTTKTTFRLIGALVAMAVIATAGGVIVSASTGIYDTIIINGEEKRAKYGDYGNDVRMWDYEENGMSYSVFVYGDFDEKNDTLCFSDYGDYFLASTDPNQKLNLYTDIDKSSNATLTEKNGQKLLCITDDLGYEYINLSEDKKDGKTDGKIRVDDDTCETYAILPNGSVVNTIKHTISNDKDEEKDRELWNNIWSGMESSDFWDNFWSNFNN